jgi:hypothetical protein
MSSDKKPPVARVSVGIISAAIWRNASQGKQPFYNTSFELRFKDDQGNWKSGDSYSHSDLLLLSKCAELAFEKILELKQQDQETEAEAA